MTFIIIWLQQTLKIGLAWSTEQEIKFGMALVLILHMILWNENTPQSLPQCDYFLQVLPFDIFLRIVPKPQNFVPAIITYIIMHNNIN